MKKPVIALLFCLLGASMLSIGQQKKPKAKASYKGAAYWGEGHIGSGPVPLPAVQRNWSQPIYVKDTAGNMHRALSFSLMYAEIGAYEDSLGRPVIMAENYHIPCDSGRVPNFWSQSLEKRVKMGDTLFFDNILYATDTLGKYRFYASPIRLTIKD